VTRTPPRKARARAHLRERSAPVFSPADAAALGRGRKRAGTPSRVLVGGRVLRASQGELVLADAVDTVQVTLARRAPTHIEPGDLVVVAGRLGRSGVEGARLIEHHPGSVPAAVSEFGRLALAGVGRNLVARAAALRTVRRYFDGQGFLEVETPVRVPSPGLDAYVDAVRADGGFLITSPELHMKRLVVGGLPRVYQLARTTRAGETGALHEPEFTMLEWYRAFSGMAEVVRDTEQLVAAVVGELRGELRVPLAAGHVVDVTPPFERLTVRDAFREYAGVRDAADLARADEGRYFELLVERVEPGLALLPRAALLHEFPITQAALARPCPHDPEVAERFELYVGGVELCNGFGELTDPAEQRRRFEAEYERRRRSGAPLHPIDERFLAALEEGLPPSGGNALGFDRLVALSLGKAHVADVMAFPKERL